MHKASLSSCAPPTPTTGCRNSSRASSTSSSRRSRPSCCPPRAEYQLEQRLLEFSFTLTVRALASLRKSRLFAIAITLTFRADVATLMRFFSYSCRLSALVVNFSPLRHSEHCTGIALCQYQLRPSRGGSHTEIVF